MGFEIQRKSSVDALDKSKFLPKFLSNALDNYKRIAIIGTQSPADMILQCLRKDTFQGVFNDNPEESSTFVKDINGLAISVKPLAQIDNLPPDTVIIVSSWKNPSLMMSQLSKLRTEYNFKVISFHDLVKEAYLFEQGYNILSHHVSLNNIAGYFFGEKVYGDPKLYTSVPLEGRTVLELGPLDGSMSGCILQHKPDSLTCVESHFENFLKYHIAKKAFSLDNFHLIFDDFHNVTKRIYGTFDVLYAHGVIYHSQEPLLLCENLSEIAPSIIVGTYCRDTQKTPKNLKVFHWRNKEWIAEMGKESPTYIGGPGFHGAYFFRDDYQSIFESLGYKVKDILFQSKPDTKMMDYYQFAATR